MKPLPEKFTKGGFDFVLVKRIGLVALYQKIRDFDFRVGKVWKTFKHRDSWEVFIIQQHAAREIAGVKIEACEAVPCSESWGIKGWSYMTLADAEKRFNTLINNEK